ncbi:MAG: dicarboxylate/amino acid:cation symporter [Candidatus Latescibacteria bacterium]|nr:dicarboxylate/amino acid:cation symporter [Candidatus Latescibacterota bacterium]
MADSSGTRWPLHTKIFLGLVIGSVCGVGANLVLGDDPNLAWFVSHVTEPAGRIFLRLIFMVVIPLVFSSLTLGVAELGDIRRLGRIGAKTFGYTLIVTTISVVIGLTLVNLFRPGESIDPAIKQRLLDSVKAGSSTAAPTPGEVNFGIQTLVNIVPDNPLSSAVNAFKGEMLGVMFFSLLVGVALALSDPERTKTLKGVLEGVYDVVMRIIGMAMRLAPYGVAALLFSLTSRFGFTILQQLAAFVLITLTGLAIHQFVVYSLLVKYLGGLSPLTFFRQIKEVMLTAFSTSSSNATLPTAMRVTETNLGIPRQITGFVLTLGSTANQNGTALYEGVTVLFIAQLFGIHLSLNAQIVVVLMSILSGVGTAGVPGGSIPLIVILLETVGIPGAGIGIILGVDRLLDMCRTVLNVTGDITAAVYVARSETARTKDEG